MFARAILARTNRPQEIEAENSRRVAVVKIDLQGIVANRMSRLSRKFGLEHREQRGGQYRISLRPFRQFFHALVIAHRARALLAQVGKIVMARVSIGPRDIDTRSRRYVDFHLCGLSSLIDWDRHRVAVFLRVNLSPQTAREYAPGARVPVPRGGRRDFRLPGNASRPESYVPRHAVRAAIPE
jgi:hypothetical protein